jgi:hypothetical protein
MSDGAVLAMSEIAVDPDCQKLKKLCDRLSTRRKGIDRVDPTYPIREERVKKHFRVIGRHQNGFIVKVHLGQIVQFLHIKTTLSRKTLCEYLNAEWDAAIGK